MLKANINPLRPPVLCVILDLAGIKPLYALPKTNGLTISIVVLKTKKT